MHKKDAERMKKKKPIRTIYTDHYYSNGDLRSFILPLYITRIASVKDLDTGKEWKLNLTHKTVYSYFCGLGFNYGYNSIYPNITDIADCIATNEKTVRNAIKTLNEIGLIKIEKMKQNGRFDSNHYWVYRPNLISRREWLNIDRDIMRGKNYTFDPKQFHKKKENIRNDKLLIGLLDR